LVANVCKHLKGFKLVKKRENNLLFLYVCAIGNNSQGSLRVEKVNWEKMGTATGAKLYDFTE
jgi:hypothetical protein